MSGIGVGTCKGQKSAATANTIGGVNMGNMLSGNTLDASDASTGARTAGTANTWRANTGVTSNPPGLLNN